MMMVLLLGLGDGDDGRLPLDLLIKKIIADFAGVPYRSSWRSVQLAAAHLAHHL